MPLPWVKEISNRTFKVNLPKKEKKTQPQKQEIKPEPIAVVPKKEEPTPAKKIAVGGLKSKLGSKSFSIKQTLKQKEEENKKVEENTSADTFTFDDLMSLWKEQATLAKELKKKSYYACLTKQPPVLKDKFIIEVTVDNKVQEETVNKEKPELIEYLKKKLNNYSIQLSIIVTEQVKEVHLYTDRDKFSELVKKNPDLLYLKEKFNLDFEF